MALRLGDLLATGLHTAHTQCQPVELSRRPARAPCIIPASDGSIGTSMVPVKAPSPAPNVAACVLQAGTRLPGREEGAVSCLTYNVLLPNSEDGWWIYKYYREDGDHTTWPARKVLLKQQMLAASADIVCFQECSELSFNQDFDFMSEIGYGALMHEKKGRMRPATFWKTDRIELLAAFHKDRTLVTALKLREPPHNIFWVINCHLCAGPQADRRLRQAEEALRTVANEAKKLKISPGKDGFPCIFCGDMNSQGRTGVDALLVVGEVGPDFQESGDPTEKGQQGKHVTTKVKKQTVGLFSHAARAIFGDSPPATLLCTNIDSKMLHDDGSLTPAIIEAINAVFDRLCAGNDVMDNAACEEYLITVNKELGRGSEFRAVHAKFEASGKQQLTREEFRDIYAEELAEGKFWGVEHDLRVLANRGLAVPSDGPCALCFDHLYFTNALRLVGVQEPLSDEKKKAVWSHPWEVLPNTWHPSDHLPVAAAFAFCN